MKQKRIRIVRTVYQHHKRNPRQTTLFSCKRSSWRVIGWGPLPLLKPPPLARAPGTLDFFCAWAGPSSPCVAVPPTRWTEARVALTMRRRLLWWWWLVVMIMEGGSTPMRPGHSPSPTYYWGQRTWGGMTSWQAPCRSKSLNTDMERCYF